MEHYFHTIQGWFSYPDIYRHVVNECNTKDNYHFVEVGSWRGRSTTFMAVEIINSGKTNIKFDAIDTWVGSTEHYDNDKYKELFVNDNLYKEFLHNISPVRDVVHVVRNTSIEASKLYKDNSLDFILIDASHDYANVKLDIEHWWPKLVLGGIMAGDDYSHSWSRPPHADKNGRGLIEAVDEFFNNINIPIQIVNNVNWVVQKA